MLIDQPLHDKKNRTASELQACGEAMGRWMASGEDGMPLERFVRLGDKLDTVVLDLLNDAWREGEFPTDWRTAVIVPIPKPRTTDKTKPGNYRGISLLPCLAASCWRLYLTRGSNGSRRSGGC